METKSDIYFKTNKFYECNIYFEIEEVVSFS